MNQSIQLRKVARTDQLNVFEGLSNPAVYRHMSIQYLTYETTAEQMDWYDSLWSTGKGAAFVIEEVSTGSFCGVISVYHIQHEHLNAEIGYWLLPAFQGKGYAFAAMKLMLDYCQHTLKLHRLYAEVEIDNPSSSRLLANAGFKLEGIKKECEWKDGRWIDLEYWALIF